ncbi:suppressor APC domain-containing protein 2-like [Scyliorhinus canicula]|uniref:suppressor APC domain-containing protein 2-like n=1 Tax=Scyliorhinus canicula TaxID=7830 RepID=UPI0018F3DB16|nr:suppressor APC domain-containing protein 2-like [Scyliorhinus canicula]
MSRPELPQPRAEQRCLPRAFLLSLRTLFDILDQEGRGSVELREIESRWPGEGSREPALPPAMLPCLRRAAAPGGQLTFPRLLAGIRTALQQQDSVTPAEGPPQRPELLLDSSQRPDTGGRGRDNLAPGNNTWAGDGGPGVGQESGPKEDGG